MKKLHQMCVNLGPTIGAWVRAEATRREVSISEVLRSLVLAEIARSGVSTHSLSTHKPQAQPFSALVEASKPSP